MVNSGGPGLTYYLPEPEKLHTVLHIPGSHTLYVGPLSCMRRHAIHETKFGNRRDASFLFITETDVVSGRYEELMVESIGNLIELLEPSPHIFFIAVFCIDDLLGTDEDALLQTLRGIYPDRQFAMEHIDPVSLDETLNMGMRKHANLYSFIKPVVRHDRGVNFLGNFVSLDPKCEFLALLRSWNCGPVRELFHCESYEDYQDMGKSCLSVVLRYMGMHSGDFMRDVLGIPYYVFTASYDAETISRGYEEIAELLGKDRPDFTAEIKKAKKDAEDTAQLLNGMPVAIDSSASLTPFATAKALLDYGFNIRFVFRSNHSFKLDAEAEAYIAKNCSQVIITRAESYTHLYERIGESECLAIGADCARVLRARHFADVWHDEGYFGFHGIHRLMATIRDAVSRTADWSDIPQLRVKGNEE